MRRSNRAGICEMRKRTASGKSTSCWRLSFWLFSIGFRIITALFHKRSSQTAAFFHWCGNLSIKRDAELNICFNTLEVYGLNVFAVKGAFPALMVYFRPTKSIKAYIDSREAALLRQSRVVEYIKRFKRLLSTSCTAGGREQVESL